jgi:hypothetical protein
LLPRRLTLPFFQASLCGVVPSGFAPSAASRAIFLHRAAAQPLRVRPWALWWLVRVGRWNTSMRPLRVSSIDGCALCSPSPCFAQCARLETCAGAPPRFASCRPSPSSEVCAILPSLFLAAAPDDLTFLSSFAAVRRASFRVRSLCCKPDHPSATTNGATSSVRRLCITCLRSPRSEHARRAS